jgi:Spy/CpxP family protein refolding chaperone
MSKKTLSWLLIISLVINISTIGTFGYYQWFKPDKKKRSQSSRRHRDSLQKSLGLTDEQSEKMTALRKKLFDEIKPKIDAVRKSRSELVEMIKQDSTSLELMNAKIDLINDLENKIHKKATANLLNYRTILTDEQRRKFVEMVAGRMFGSDYRKSRRSSSHKHKPNPEVENKK